MTHKSLEARPLILAIDDDDMILLMLMDILSHEGFEVLGAPNAQAGLKLFRQRRPALVLLDVMMPEMDGYTCLEALRAMPGNHLLPIVLLTGMDDIDSVHRAFGLGATDFITKPINWPTLPYRLHYMMRASQALSDLANSESVLRTAQKTARLGNWEWRVDTGRMTGSDEALTILGVLSEDINAQPMALFKTIYPSDAQQLHQGIELCIKHGTPFSLETRAVHTDQIVHQVHIRGEAEMQQGEVARLIGTVQDITERCKIEDQVRFLAYHDPLTGLSNRTLFKEVLGQTISYCDRYEASLSALFVNINQFKRINETLGLAVGDRVLQLFADRLVQFVRDSDYVTTAADIAFAETKVSRLGSSEFTLMLNHITDTRNSVKIAKRIFQCMEAPFEVEGHEIYLSLSIGIAVYPGDGPDVNTFIKHGEFAMHQAREQGQNSHRFFNKSLNVAALHKLSMENHLRRAIERDELILHYQPIVDLRNNQVVGMEALVRWQHPEFGLVLPVQFIPIAEDSGLICPISDWILATACRQTRDWQLSGLPLVVSVNISATQLHQKAFSQHVSEALKTSGLDTQSLRLELTEGILLDNATEVLETLGDLYALGIHVSIDDFGTGYSSLAYLKKLSLSELKIDSSFVADIPHCTESMKIVAAIIALAKAFSLEVVAEGVENSQQAEFLRLQGCHKVQGYLYSKPLPPDEFIQFIMKFQQGNS